MSPRALALLEATPDKWVVLSEDESRIVSQGDDFQAVAEEARKNGVAEPILIRIPSDWSLRVLIA